jgi:hypothetical protein
MYFRVYLECRRNYFLIKSCKIRQKCIGHFQPGQSKKSNDQLRRQFQLTTIRIVVELELNPARVLIPVIEFQLLLTIHPHKIKLLLLLHFKPIYPRKRPHFPLRSNRNRQNLNNATNHKRIKHCESPFYIHRSNLSEHCANSIGVEVVQSKKVWQCYVDTAAGQKVHLCH